MHTREWPKHLHWDDSTVDLGQREPERKLICFIASTRSVAHPQVQPGAVKMKKYLVHVPVYPPGLSKNYFVS